LSVVCIFLSVLKIPGVSIENDLINKKPAFNKKLNFLELNIEKPGRPISIYFKKIVKLHASDFKILIKNQRFREEFFIFLNNKAVTNLLKSFFLLPWA